MIKKYKLLYIPAIIFLALQFFILIFLAGSGNPESHPFRTLISFRVMYFMCISYIISILYQNEYRKPWIFLSAIIAIEWLHFIVIGLLGHKPTGSMLPFVVFLVINLIIIGIIRIFYYWFTRFFNNKLVLHGKNPCVPEERK